MFTSVLVATDLSDASDHSDRLFVPVRALAPNGRSWSTASAFVTWWRCQHLLAPMVEPKLQAQKAALAKDGFAVTVEITPGLPQHDINRVAVEKDCSLIVLGTHGPNHECGDPPGRSGVGGHPQHPQAHPAWCG